MLLAVVVISFTIPWLLPVSDFFKGVSTIPGIGALSLAVIQLWRDKISHERQKELQRKQHFFNLGVTSHMASVVFDKHVDFCEKYIAQMYDGLEGLFRDGPTKEALSFSGKLAKIRIQYRPWLTEEMIEKVLPYEKALRNIGAYAFVEPNLPVGEERNRIIEKMFNTFSELTEIKKEKELNEQIATELIINHLQQVLGIRELTLLRQKVIEAAVKSIEEVGK